MSRSCGICQLCCEVVGIDKIDKPAGERCPDQCVKGCAIYDERPEPCRTFKCLWLGAGDRVINADEWGPSLRPDRCWVVFYVEHNDVVGADVMVAHAHPRRKKAFIGKAVARVIDRVVENGVTAFMVIGDTRIVRDLAGTTVHDMTQNSQSEESGE